MQKQLKQVQAFMTLFGQTVEDKPTLPSKQVGELRVRLLEEEVKELNEALVAGDLVAVLDAFTDIRYVLEGAILTMGMQNIAEEAFDAVHASNMTKACDSLEFAESTKESYAKNGIETYIEESNTESSITGGKLLLVKRAADGKVLKSIHWKEQDLKSIIEREKRNEESRII